MEVTDVTVHVASLSGIGDVADGSRDAAGVPREEADEAIRRADELVGRSVPGTA